MALTLHHLRVEQNKLSTRGILVRHDEKIEERIIWICDILEDGMPADGKKIKGLTRIDPKTYYVVPIQYGRFYEKYKSDPSEGGHNHKFAIALMDQPGKDTAGRHGSVRVHKLNTTDQTDGCPGTGNRVEYNQKTKLFEIPGGLSTPAYLRLYNLLFQQYDETTNKFKQDVFWVISEQFI